MALINLRLLAHPINWAFVWIVLALSAMAWHTIHSHIQESAPDASISPD